MKASSHNSEPTKSDTDKRRRPLVFEVGNHIFLKVMFKRRVIRFSKQGKLAPRYIGPFEILERVGIVAYLLALSPSLSGVHEVSRLQTLEVYSRSSSCSRLGTDYC